MNNRAIVLTLCVLALAVFVVSCASTQQALVRSKTSYDKVWKACLDSLFDVGYSYTSADPKTGLIIAGKAVILGEGTVARLNIMVTRVSDNTEVSVSYVPAPATIGGYGTVDKYVTAVKKRIPDIEVTKTK